MLQRLGTDNWQFVLWCIGKAGTGKSTFANLFAHIYSKEDVGTLSQIIEEKFGMQHFFDPVPKFVVLAPDLSKGISLPLTIFLNWISAESACLPRKNKGAIERDLDIPFIAASNIMALLDIKDALARRCAFLKFVKTIRKSNTRLLDYIVKNELPIIIKKFTLAYWHYFQKYGHEDIWSWIPAYFRETREEMAAESNSIRFWLKRSGKVDVLPEEIRKVKNEFTNLMCTPLTRLEDHYNEWKKTLPGKEKESALKWTFENYAPIFEELKCPLVKVEECFWPPNSNLPHHLMKNEWMVRNCVIVEDAKSFTQQLQQQGTQAPQDGSSVTRKRSLDVEGNDDHEKKKRQKNHTTTPLYSNQ
jgi:phage/plasmid-associated DNA primase